MCVCMPAGWATPLADLHVMGWGHTTDLHALVVSILICPPNSWWYSITFISEGLYGSVVYTCHSNYNETAGIIRTTSDNIGCYSTHSYVVYS